MGGINVAGIAGVASGVTAANSAASGRRDDPAKVKDAACQFEALLLSQMLKSERESSSGGAMGDDEDESSLSVMEMGDEQFAHAIALRGGLGIASMVAAGLQPKAATDSNSE